MHVTRHCASCKGPGVTEVITGARLQIFELDEYHMLMSCVTSRKEKCECVCVCVCVSCVCRDMCVS